MFAACPNGAEVELLSGAHLFESVKDVTIVVYLAFVTARAARAEPMDDQQFSDSLRKAAVLLCLAVVLGSISGP